MTPLATARSRSNSKNQLSTPAVAATPVGGAQTPAPLMTPRTIDTNAPAMETMALELAVYRRTARLVYHGLHDMDTPPILPSGNSKENQVVRLPRAALEVFDMLSTEELFTKNPKNVMTVLSAIQGVTSEVCSSIQRQSSPVSPTFPSPDSPCFFPDFLFRRSNP